MNLSELMLTLQFDFTAINQMLSFHFVSSPFLSQSEIPTVLIALELLDNLPHDKIGRCIATNAILQAKVVPVDSSGLIGHDERELHHIDEINEMQSTSNIDITRQYTEEFSPMNDDPLLQRILSIAPNLYTPMISHGPRWIPTVALGVLMKLFECRPNSSVAFADFDWLPPPDVGNYSSAKHHENDSEILLPGAEPAIGDPLVTDMEGNDHLSYLTSPPDALCDILFPSDFGRLAAFIKQYHASIANSDIDAKAMKQSDFLMKYGSTEVNKTKSWLTGYSPLINDFGNCSVLTVIPQHRTD